MQGRPCDIAPYVRRILPNVLQCWGCAVASQSLFGNGTNGAKGRMKTVVDIAGDVDGAVLPCADSPYEHRSLFGDLTVFEYEQTRSRMIQGVSEAGDLRVIRSTLERPADYADRRATARRKLQLKESECAVLILPPADASGAGFTAVWAALLVAQIHANTRILIPELGETSRRLRALVAATKFDQLLTREQAATNWGDALVACDVGIQLHSPWGGVCGVTELLSIGHSVVIFDAPIAREWSDLPGRMYTCDHAAPKPAAAALLLAVDAWRERCDAAPSSAMGFRGQYARLYEELLSHG